MAGNMARVNDSTYEKLRIESAKWQAQFRRQVSMGILITAALRVAENHAPELEAAIWEILDNGRQ